MNLQYCFEGRVLRLDDPGELSSEHLDVLAGLVISYRLLSKDRMTKAARAQEAFIRGYLYGLESCKVIDSNISEDLYMFFIVGE